MSTQQGSSQLLTDGLIFFFDPFNTKCYSSGLTASDLSNSFGNRGSLRNGVSHDGFSFVFDGTSDYILVDRTVELREIQVPMTIIGWFNDNGSNPRPTVFSQYKDTLSTQLVKLVRPQGGNFAYFASKPVFPYYTACSIPNSYQFNTWTFFSVSISGTLSSSNAEIRVNNIIATFSIPQMTTVDPTVEIRIGSAESTNQQSGEFFSGRISNIMVYNRALSRSEVDYTYSVTKIKFGL